MGTGNRKNNLFGASYPADRLFYASLEWPVYRSHLSEDTHTDIAVHDTGLGAAGNLSESSLFHRSQAAEVMEMDNAIPATK